MSNKKQSSVEYAVEKLEKLISPGNQIIISLILEQAKAMHNDEIAKAYDDAIMKGRQEDGNEYYNETYGGDNE